MFYLKSDNGQGNVINYSPLKKIRLYKGHDDTYRFVFIGEDDLQSLLVKRVYDNVDDAEADLEKIMRGLHDKNMNDFILIDQKCLNAIWEASAYPSKNIKYRDDTN